MIQKQLDAFWGWIVDQHTIDLKTHSITLVIRSGTDRPAVLRFVDVSAFRFVHDAYVAPPEILETWEAIELSEIYHLPELKRKASHASELHSGEFNFLLEMYRSQWLIKARTLDIQPASFREQ